MLAKNKVVALLFFVATGLVGCAPSHSGWEDELNSVIGDAFDKHYKISNGPFWSPVNDNKVADKIVDEQTWKRYYLTWVRQCKYSVLVDDDGIIRSWRYETNDRGSCYVF